MQAVRGSVLGQMHYGNLHLAPEREGHKFFVKFCWIVNVTGVAGLFLTFRFLDMFPPHEQPFMSAVAWYFIFGFGYSMIALLVLKVGMAVENNAVQKAVSNNRRYEWHSHYDTSKMSEEDLKKMANVKKPQQETNAPPVDIAKKYLQATTLLCLASLFTCGLGVYAFCTTVL